MTTIGTNRTVTRTHGTTTDTAPTGAVRARRRFRMLAVGAAALTNGALYLAGRALGTDFVLVSPDNPVPHPLILAEIVMITLFFAVAGWGTLAALERFTRHARVVWSVLAGAVLVLSFVPLAAMEITVDTEIMLGVMHVVVAAALFPMLRRDRVGG